jgi:hypothetical protein
MSKKIMTHPATSPSVPPKVPTQQIGVVIFVLVGLSLAALIGAQRLSQLVNPEGNSQTQETQDLTLPEGWKMQENTGEDERILFQAYKEVVAAPGGKTAPAGVTPSVTALVSPLPEGAEPETYTEELFKAAQGSLPSLTYTQNEFTADENLSVRRLSGSLEMNKEKLGFKQQIYFHDGQVYTFTALFPIDPNSTISTEVEIIFDQVLGQLGL